MAVILFFDGACKLCNSFVNFIVTHDKRNRFHFATFQSSKAQELLPPLGFDTSSPNSILLYENGKICNRSTAVMRVARLLGFPYSMAQVGYVLPRPVRDVLYNFIAANRHKWFGQPSKCRVPLPSEQDKFFD